MAVVFGAAVAVESELTAQRNESERRHRFLSDRTLGLAVPARIRRSHRRGVCVSLPGVRRERLGAAHLEFSVPFSQRRFLVPHGRRRRRRSSPSFPGLARHYARSRSRHQRSGPPSRQHRHRYLFTGHRHGRAPLRSSRRLRTSAGPSAREPRPCHAGRGPRRGNSRRRLSPGGHLITVSGLTPRCSGLAALAAELDIVKRTGCRHRGPRVVSHECRLRDR
jgi:hypothetical protein